MNIHNQLRLLRRHRRYLLRYGYLKTLFLIQFRSSNNQIRIVIIK